MRVPFQSAKSSPCKPSPALGGEDLQHNVSPAADRTVGSMRDPGLELSHNPQPSIRAALAPDAKARVPQSKAQRQQTQAFLDQIGHLPPSRQQWELEVDIPEAVTKSKSVRRAAQRKGGARSSARNKASERTWLDWSMMPVALLVAATIWLAFDTTAPTGWFAKAATSPVEQTAEPRKLSFTYFPLDQIPQARFEPTTAPTTTSPSQVEGFVEARAKSDPTQPAQSASVMTGYETGRPAPEPATETAAVPVATPSHRFQYLTRSTVKELSQVVSALPITERADDDAASPDATGSDVDVEDAGRQQASGSNGTDHQAPAATNQDAVDLGAKSELQGGPQEAPAPSNANPLPNEPTAVPKVRSAQTTLPDRPRIRRPKRAPTKTARSRVTQEQTRTRRTVRTPRRVASRPRATPASRPTRTVSTSRRTKSLRQSEPKRRAKVKAAVRRAQRKARTAQTRQTKPRRTRIAQPTSRLGRTKARRRRSSTVVRRKRKDDWIKKVFSRQR